MATTLQVERAKIEIGQRIIQEISQFQPFSSISFFATDEILQTLEEVRLLVNWGMAKNKPKMKAASLDILDIILNTLPGDPVNLNLDEYEHKSVAETAALLKRSLKVKIDGLKFTDLVDESTE